MLEIIQEGNDPVRVGINMSQVFIHGLTYAVMDTAKGFEKVFDGNTIYLKGFMPRSELLNHFKVNGRILMFPIEGEGTSNVTFHDIVLATKFKVKSVLRDNEEYMEVDKIKMKFVPGR